MKNIALLFILLVFGFFGSITAQNNFPEFPKTEIPNLETPSTSTETAELQLMPNPVSNYLRVIFPKVWQNEIQYSIADAYGQVVVANQSVNPPDENHEYGLPVEELPTGAYILKIRNGNERVVKRFEVR